jgi:hypothetical protein
MTHLCPKSGSRLGRSGHIGHVRASDTDIYGPICHSHIILFLIFYFLVFFSFLFSALSPTYHSLAAGHPRTRCRSSTYPPPATLAAGRRRRRQPTTSPPAATALVARAPCRPTTKERSGRSPATAALPPREKISARPPTFSGGCFFLVPPVYSCRRRGRPSTTMLLAAELLPVGHLAAQSLSWRWQPCRHLPYHLACARPSVAGSSSALVDRPPAPLPPELVGHNGCAAPHQIPPTPELHTGLNFFQNR